MSYTTISAEDIELSIQNSSNQDHLSSVPTPKSTLIKSTTFLNGLRGLASLCVYNYHFLLNFDVYRGFGQGGQYLFVHLPIIRLFCGAGAVAVPLFFVLAGFVLSQSSIRLLQSGERERCKQRLIASVIRRPVRLYAPCFVISLCVALLLQLPGDIYPEFLGTKAEPSLGAELRRFIENFLDFFNPLHEHQWKTAHYFVYDLPMWTIPVELNGSALVFSLLTVYCFCFPRPKVVAAIGTATFLILPWTGWWIPACYVGGFTLTLVNLYNLDAEFYRLLTTRARSVILNIALMSVLYLASQPGSDGHKDWSLETPGWNLLTRWIPNVYDECDFYRFWTTYASIFLIYLTLRLRWLQTLLNKRPLQYLGRISFMLFLVHLPVIIMTERCRTVFGINPLRSKPAPRWWDELLYVPPIGPAIINLRTIVCWCTLTPMVCLLADSATRHVDARCERWGRKITQSLGPE